MPTISDIKTVVTVCAPGGDISDLLAFLLDYAQSGVLPSEWNCETLYESRQQMQQDLFGSTRMHTVVFQFYTSNADEKAVGFLITQDMVSITSLRGVVIRVDIPSKDEIPPPNVSTVDRSPPIHAGHFRALAKLWFEAEEALIGHVSQGSPQRGFSNSFMARVKLCALRDYINRVLGKD